MMSGIGASALLWMFRQGSLDQSIADSRPVTLLAALAPAVAIPAPLLDLVLLADGSAIDGKYIQQISPDWHRIKGWAEGYHLGRKIMQNLR